MAICCFTSFSFAYFSRAQVLSETLRRAHPDWTLCAAVVDRPPPDFPAHQVLEFFDIVLEVEDLGIPNVFGWLFKHDIVEACTAVKGYALLRLLDSHDIVVYLDPDIAVFHPLWQILERLETASILLTPHQVDANEFELAILDNEGASLRHGIFNLGFLAVRKDANGWAFAKWWTSQLHRACYEDLPNGIFTDQKYCDLVPALFDGVDIERDPGFNVASWNLSRRRIRVDEDGSIRVNGSPLKFVHFTKIGGAGDYMVERYAGDNIEVFEIWKWYRREVFESGRLNAPKGYWWFGQFSNGVPISRAIRIYYRGRPDLEKYFRNPFDASEGSFYQWMQREAPEVLEAEQ